MHAFDGRTDRQTDRKLIARPRLHFMQRGNKTKIKRTGDQKKSENSRSPWPWHCAIIYKMSCIPHGTRNGETTASSFDCHLKCYRDSSPICASAELIDDRRVRTWRGQYIHCLPAGPRMWSLVWSRRESTEPRQSTAGLRNHRTSVCKTLSTRELSWEESADSDRLSLESLWLAQRSSPVHRQTLNS